MARFGDYETTRELASRGLTSVYVAQRVVGSGPPTAVIKVLQLPGSVPSTHGQGAVGAAGSTDGNENSPAPDGAAAAAVASMASRVFISHPARDKAVADAVCNALEVAGLPCWIAPRDILPGATWASSIVTAIAGAKAMVVIFSANANESSHIRREVERAVHHDVPIAPVRVEDVMPQGDLEYFLSASHWLDAIAPPVEQHLPKLVDTVKALASRSRGNGEGGNSGGGGGRSGAMPGVHGVPGRSASPAARAAAVQFLEAARVQQEAAQASPHWAPVYITGEVPGGAYYATAHFRQSVDGLIESRVRLTASHLHHLIDQTLQGLIDFQQALGRPHGDLKPSNVLLRHDQPDVPENVALADPLPTAQLTHRHTASADLQALGKMIYWLVVGRTQADKIPWPAEEGPGWSALGRAGRGWRTLLNELLDPKPSAAFGLEQVREQLERLKPRERRRRRSPVKMLVAAAAVLVVAGAGVAGYVAYRNGVRPWERVISALRPSPTPATVEKPVVQPQTTTPPQVVPPSLPSDPKAAERALLRRLMDAQNPSAPFKVSVVGRIEPCPAIPGTPPDDCMSFTVRADGDVFLFLLTEDPAGEVSLMLPNATKDHCLFMKAGTQVLPEPTDEYVFPVMPPHGRTRVKVIASTQMVELVGAVKVDGALTGIYSLAVEYNDPATGKPTRRFSSDLNEILAPTEWAAAEIVMMTRPPKPVAGPATRPATRPGG